MEEIKINNCKCGSKAELDYSDVKEIYGDEWQTIEVSCVSAVLIMIISQLTCQNTKTY